MDAAETCRIEIGIPDVRTYLALRRAGHLSRFAPEAAVEGLGGTLFGVLAKDGAETVGMGRLVGDGGCFVQVVDIVVLPNYQGRGLGRAIMQALMDYVHESLPPSVYVSLMADVPADRLYEEFGFKHTAPATVGMAMKKL
ncbi:MAG: GNAT family N-acetyltransferase [Pseudomonadota bacterium]